jgi:hypothetical protein
MKKPAGFLFCLVFLYVSQVNAQVPAVLGVWEFDKQASTLLEGFPLASEIRSYELREDGYLVNIVIRRLENGQPAFIQVVSKSDGKDYPQYGPGPLAEFQLYGTTTPLTYSETVIDDRSVSIVAKVNGQVNNTGTRSISADGETMTLDVNAIYPDGREVPFQLVFRRL